MESRNEDFCKSKVNRHEKLVADAMPWRDLWQRIAEYFAPRLGTITVERYDADLLDERLYDDIGKETAEDFAAGCVNYMVPAGDLWGRMEPDYPDPSEAATSWFTESSKRVLELMVSSGFYLEIHDDLITEGAFGTSNMKVEKGRNGNAYKFEEIPVGKYCTEIDEQGIPDTTYYEFQYTTKQCIDRWGEDNLHDSMLEASKSDSQVTKKWRILNVVWPRQEGDYDEGMGASDRRPYASTWIDVTNNHQLLDDSQKEEGFYENPYIVSRMYKTADSHWGYSLGMRTLPKVMQLNQMEEDRMLAAEKRLDPPWIAPDEGSTKLSNTPGGVSYYKATLDPRHRPEQIDLKYDVHGTQEDIQLKRDEIRKSWFIDMFQVFAERTQQKTATEVMAIIEEKLVLFTPFFARYTKEKLDRILQRCFNIAMREGYIEEPPPEVIENGGGYKIVYTSRIANTLRLMENKQYFQMLDLAMPMAQLDPSIVKVGKWREILRRFADNLAVDPDLMNAEEDIIAEIEKEGQMMEAQQGAAIAKDAAKAASDAPGEMLEFAS